MALVNHPLTAVLDACMVALRVPQPGCFLRPASSRACHGPHVTVGVCGSNRAAGCRYVDYPITDVLQMMGRAGRPQYDRTAKAVIMVHEPKKGFYKKFLYEPFPVESALHEQLVDHLNAEIVNGTIRRAQEAVDYLTWTYLFQRLPQNPAYYGVPGGEEDEEAGAEDEAAADARASEHLSGIVEDCLEALQVRIMDGMHAWLRVGAAGLRGGWKCGSAVPLGAWQWLMARAMRPRLACGASSASPAFAKHDSTGARCGDHRRTLWTTESLRAPSRDRSQSALPRRGSEREPHQRHARGRAAVSHTPLCLREVLAQPRLCRWRLAIPPRSLRRPSS